MKEQRFSTLFCWYTRACAECVHLRWLRMGELSILLLPQMSSVPSVVWSWYVFLLSLLNVFDSFCSLSLCSVLLFRVIRVHILLFALVQFQLNEIRWRLNSAKKRSARITCSLNAQRTEHQIERNSCRLRMPDEKINLFGCVQCRCYIKNNHTITINR